MTTAFVLAFMVALPLMWEAYAVLGSPATISQAFKELGHEWTAFVIYAVSVLPGHFFVNFDRSLVNRVGGNDAAEVAVVLWIGWAVFVVFRANPEWTPLGPWPSLALVLFSVLVGALVWSQQPV